MTKRVWLAPPESKGTQANAGSLGRRPGPARELYDSITRWGAGLAVRPATCGCGLLAGRPPQPQSRLILSRNNNRVALQADHVTWCVAGEASTFCIMFVKVERLKSLWRTLLCLQLLFFFSFSFLEVEILVILGDLKSYLLWKSWHTRHLIETLFRH